MMPRRLKLVRQLYLSIILVAGILGIGQPAAAFETTAREAILIDATTGAVLLEKDSEVSMPPASMSKIMTVYMVFEALKDGRLSLDDKLTVSEKAWRMGGSKMFVEVGDEVRVEDLLRGVIVQSGNDACIVLAEALGGSEEGFAEADQTVVGVHPDPQDIGEFAESDRFDRGYLHLAATSRSARAQAFAGRL
jgi:D-alanyl-D-alanine carboxypeptidase (penicillin-binding protein 5/6)